MQWIDWDGWLWEHRDGKPEIVSKQGEAYLAAYAKGLEEGRAEAAAEIERLNERLAFLDGWLKSDDRAKIFAEQAEEIYAKEETK